MSSTLDPRLWVRFKGQMDTQKLNSEALKISSPEDFAVSRKAAMKMTNVFLLIIVVLIAGLAGTIYYFSTMRPPGPATISGRITDAATGANIAGATVSLDGLTYSTASDGTFSFTVEVGSYTVAVDVEGYEPETVPVDARESREYTVDISLVVPPLAPKEFHRRFIVVIQDDEVTRIQLFQSGVFDRATVTPARLKDVNGTKLEKYQIFWMKDPTRTDLAIAYIGFNTQKEPLNNLKVRQAIAYMTNYPVIFDQILAGVYFPVWGIIPKTILGYTEFGVTPFVYSRAQAGQLIEESGIDPANYTLEITYNAGNVARAQVAALLQTELARLGFNVLVRALPWAAYLEHVDTFQADIFILGWLPDYFDPADWSHPFMYGGHVFEEVEAIRVEDSADVSEHLASVKETIETEEFFVVVGEKGSGAPTPAVSGKPLIVVPYIVDEEKTEENWADPYAMVTVGVLNYRNVAIDALDAVGLKVVEPEMRAAIYHAIHIVSNRDVPYVPIGQRYASIVNWNWVTGRYINPLFSEGERADLLSTSSDAPVKDLGIGDYQNDPETYIYSTFGWPDTLDPAIDYESFGWHMFQQFGDTLVTYWKDETTYVVPDLAVAWAAKEPGDEFYFVIRGGVVAYDGWNDVTYPIDATDVLFSLWRVSRFMLDPSALLVDLLKADMDASSVLTEEEFEEVASGGLTALIEGREATVTSLEELLDHFGYDGTTAGVLKLKLKAPLDKGLRDAYLGILSGGFAEILPMEYLLGDDYEEALAAAEGGKNPSAFANYVNEVADEDPGHQLMHENPVGSGPYYIKEIVPNSYIILEVNPHYWNATLWEDLYGVTVTP